MTMPEVLYVRSLSAATLFCPCDLHQLLCVSLKDLSKPSRFETFFFSLFPDLRTSVLGAGAQGNELFPKTPQVREFMLETFTSQYYVRQVHKDLLVSRK